MADFPVSLDNLITYVKVLQPAGGPLEHLGDAVAVAGTIGEQADSLIGHFVDQARSSGASWSQIGTSMGVSKQAAQKRFVLREEDLFDSGERFSRFAPRAKAAVAASRRIAVVEGSPTVETRHMMLGLLTEPEGVAARALRRLEITDQAIRAALGSDAATASTTPDPAALDAVRFVDASKMVLRNALKAALHLGHNYIGTEHILLGVVSAGDETSTTLAGLGATFALVEGAISVELAQILLDRQRQGS
ncbi:MAG: hypothetical protein JWM34_153 [Ilumatobacteraceae bacterium]|nr:hypothetical protein [Ilumatobacteraceae bacterium]